MVETSLTVKARHVQYNVEGHKRWKKVNCHTWLRALAAKHDIDFIFIQLFGDKITLKSGRVVSCVGFAHVLLSSTLTVRTGPLKVGEAPWVIFKRMKWENMSKCWKQGVKSLLWKYDSYNISQYNEYWIRMNQDSIAHRCQKSKPFYS